MKTLFPFLLFLISFSSLAQRVAICEEMDMNFPGKIQLIMKDTRFVERILYAETDNSKFIEIEKFVPNPQNRYFRGGPEYFVTIKTSRKVYEGKLSLSSIGGEIHLYTEEADYYFTCE